MVKIYFIFFISAVAFFLLGTLVTRAMYNIQEIELFRYFMAGFFGLYFMIVGINELEKLKK